MLPVRQEEGVHHASAGGPVEGRIGFLHGCEVLTELHDGAVRGAHDEDDVCAWFIYLSALHPDTLSSSGSPVAP